MLVDGGPMIFMEYGPAKWHNGLRLGVNFALTFPGVPYCRHTSVPARPAPSPRRKRNAPAQKEG